MKNSTGPVAAQRPRLVPVDNADGLRDGEAVSPMRCLVVDASKRAKLTFFCGAFAAIVATFSLVYWANAGILSRTGL